MARYVVFQLTTVNPGPAAARAPALGGLPLSGWRSPTPASERLRTNGRSGDTSSDRTPLARMLPNVIGSMGWLRSRP
jgi:hypothetical protein